MSRVLRLERNLADALESSGGTVQPVTAAPPPAQAPLPAIEKASTEEVVLH